MRAVILSLCDIEKFGFENNIHMDKIKNLFSNPLVIRNVIIFYSTRFQIVKRTVTFMC